ncbi:MAG: hypothetical protein AAFY88_27315, partial [Acidobacteriota bacterium]
LAGRVLVNLNNGSALWSSDGTEQGTFELIDFERQAGFFAATPDRIIYEMRTPDFSGIALWSTDGTVGGNRQLSTYCTASCSQIATQRQTTPDGLVYFFGEGPNPDPNRSNSALWRTDGTVGGTFRLSEAGPTFNFSSRSFLALAGERAFFVADVGGDEELWVSDGTVAGTNRVTPWPDRARLLGGAGGDLIFLVFEPNFTQAHVWVSDGTATGTRQLASTTPGIGQPDDAFFYSRGDELLLSLRDERNAGQIWRTDGTVAGTRALEGAKASVGQGSRPSDLTVAGGSLFFSTEGSFQDPGALYKTRGDSASTVRLDVGLPDNPAVIGAAGQRVVVFGNAGLWATDGSDGGARFLAGLETSFASDLKAVALGDRLLISESLVRQFRLWVTDGTAAGTSMVGQLDTLGGSSVPSAHAV